MDSGLGRDGGTVRSLGLRFAPLLRPLRWHVAACVMLVLLAPAVTALMLWWIKILIDEVLVAGRLDWLPVAAAIYLLVVGVKFLLDYASVRLEATTVERVVVAFRGMLFRHLVSASPGTFGDRGTGDLLTHLSGDAERAEGLIFTSPLRAIGDAVSALFFVVFLLLLSWKLTIVALAVLPVLFLLVLRYSPRIRRAAKIARRTASAWSSLAEERLSAVPLIHAASAQERELERFQSSCDRARRAEIRTVTVQAWMSLLVEIVIAIGGLIVLGAGAYEMQSGALTVGGLVAFLGAVGSLYEPIRGLARIASRFQRNAAGAQRIAALLDRPSLVERSPSTPLPIRPPATIEFHDVGFGYSAASTVLRDLSFRIEPGQTVSIVGPSGAGKSTLARLLLRLLDPTAGRITVGGTDLRQASLEDLRRQIAAVFQDAYILQGTVADNLRFARPDASMTELVAAARAAHAAEFIDRLSGRYHALVGPHGGRLSGGQRQRLALARALVQDAPILILDEATAAVDSETEAMIQEALAGLAGRRTTILIGHRLASLQGADQVIVLDQGRIVESGPPAMLLQRGTRYRELFAPQLDLARLAS